MMRSGYVSTLRRLAYGSAVQLSCIWTSIQIAIAVLLAFHCELNRCCKAAEHQESGDIVITPVDQRFYVNTVLSTSLDTPGAARIVPLDQTMDISGAILDADGQGVSGADVWAASLDVNPPIREHTRTDEQGIFRLQLKTRTDWSIRAFKGNQCANITREQAWNASKASNPKLLGRIVAGCNGQCFILDRENGKAIPEARIYLDDGRVLISDDGGRADISGLNQGTHDAVVLAADREILMVEFQCVLGQDNLVKVPLKRAGTIQGQVLSAEGIPLGDAWLARRCARPHSLSADGTYLLADSDGRFVGGTKLDTFKLEMRDLADTSLEIAHAGADGYELERLPFTRSEHKSPEAYTIRLNASPERIRNSLGRYRQPPRIKLDSGPMLFSKPPAIGGENSEYSLYESRAQLLTELEPFERPTFWIMERRGSSIPVQRRVVGADGLALQDVRIERVYNPLFFPSSDEPDWIRYAPEATHSDRLGIFSFRPRASSSNTFILSHDHYATTIMDIRGLKNHHDDIVMDARQIVRGRAIDQSGNPIQDFRIRITRTSVSKENGRYEKSLPPFQEYMVQYSNKRGEFAFADELIINGNYEIAASADGMMDSVRSMRVSDDENDQRDEEFVFQLKPSTTLSIKATDAMSLDKEIVIPNLMIAMQPKKSSFVYANLSRFESCRPIYSDWIQAGNSQEELTANGESGCAAIQAPGYARHYFYWNAHTRNYHVKLVQESIIAGTIRGPSGEALPKLELAIIGRSGQFVLNEYVGEEFQIGNLARDWYTIEVSSNGKRLVRQFFILDQGQRIDLQFEFNANHELEIRHESISGERVPYDIYPSVNGISSEAIE